MLICNSQIIIETVRGGSNIRNQRGDIAVDDIQLTSSPCKTVYFTGFLSCLKVLISPSVIVYSSALANSFASPLIIRPNKMYFNRMKKQKQIGKIISCMQSLNGMFCFRCCNYKFKIRESVLNKNNFSLDIVGQLTFV